MQSRKKCDRGFKTERTNARVKVWENFRCTLNNTNRGFNENSDGKSKKRDQPIEDKKTVA